MTGMIETGYRVRTGSGVSPIEAGFGLVHASTITATTDDELFVDPPSARVELRVRDRSTFGRTAELGLEPGVHEALIRITENGEVRASNQCKLLLADPSSVVRSFSARYGSLEYDIPVVTGKGTTAPWESLWKTREVSDIVVDFEQPYKFVLWRGMAYAPSWAMDNVMTSLFFAETVEPGVFRDCCEMMSDRECRYSHGRIIHTSDARVVLHWRCALSDSAYTICRNQWVDEMFYIYPSGVAVRNVTIHLDPKDEAVWQECPDTGRRIPCSMIGPHPNGKRTFNDMEFITVNPAGATSEDVTPLDALTILDTGDFARTYRWPKPWDGGDGGQKAPQLNDYIFRLNYRHRPGVFVASPAAGMRISLQQTSGVRYEAGALVHEDRWVTVPDVPSKFADYIHWPVTRGYGTTALTDRATYQERPTHTFLGFANNAPTNVKDDGSVTWSWLCGIAPEDEGRLRRLVKAWVAPADIQGTRYAPSERAYVVDTTAGGSSVSLRVESPAVNPTFVLPGWDGCDVDAAGNGRSRAQAGAATGVERRLDRAQTVVTFREELGPDTEIHFRRHDS